MELQMIGMHCIYVIGSNIAITDKQFNFVGEYSIIKLTTDTRICDINSTVIAASKWKFNKIIFQGNAAGLNQYAFYFTGNAGSFVFTDCSFTGFGGGGIAVTATQNTDNLGGLISNCKFYNNYIGINLFTRAEYIQIIGCDIVSNTSGINVAGGNVLISNNNINYNGTGIEVLAGQNDAYGIISNNNINHNTTNINIHDIANGMTVSGNHFYSGIIRVANTTGVTFSGGKMDATIYTFDTNIGLNFENISFPNTSGNDVTLTGISPNYFNCKNLNGDLALNPKTFLPNIKSNYGFYTPILTNSTNLEASSSFPSQWFIQGRVVNVSGKVNLDPTSTSTLTKIDINLPISSSFSNDYECIGTAIGSTLVNQGAAILANISTNKAQLQFIANNSSNQSMFYNFTYQITGSIITGSIL